MRKNVKRFILQHKDNPPRRFAMNGTMYEWSKVAPQVLGEANKDLKENKDEVEHDLEQTGDEPEDQDLGSGDSQGEE